MDRKLRNVVESKIHTTYWNLHSEQTHEPFSMHSLAEALRGRGYVVDEEKEHLEPYFGYTWYPENFTLVRLRNGDCCIRQRGDNNVEIFVDKGGGDGICMYNTTLAQTVDIIIKIDDSLPKIIQDCIDEILKEEKKAKKLAVNKATVNTVVASALKGTGVLYKLTLGDRQAMLTLKLDNDLETKFSLSYKDFMKKIPYIKTTVEQLNGIMRQLEQPLRIKSTYYREKDTWTESK